MSKKNNSTEDLEAERDKLLAENKELSAQKHDLDTEANMLEAEIIGLIELNIAVLESRLDFFHEALAYHREKLKARVKLMELTKIPDSYRSRLPLTAFSEASAPTSEVPAPTAP